MKIVVHGLWHLGSVTAACLAEAGFTTVGLDPDPAVTARLGAGEPPLHEPGLPEVVKKGLATGRLSFSADPAVVAQADLVWVAFDTPVDDEDRADAAYVAARVEELFPHLKPGVVVLISSQLPVGSTTALAARYTASSRHGGVHFAYSPENLRLGKAIDVFRHPERIVVGTQDGRPNAVLAGVLSRFSDNLIWMSVESAEMVKHALNAFLATSVTFINEIATICEQVGARASDVEEGLRSEARIGRKAYLKPGGAFAGGTLARDVRFLGQLADSHGLETPLLSGILPSNAAHRQWPLRRVVERLGDLKGRRVAVLGLAYKPGTDALRRSAAVELCHDLVAKGAHVQVFDPVVRDLPSDLAVKIELRHTIGDALANAEAAVIATEWPEFRAITGSLCLERMSSPVVIDQNGFLATVLEAADAIDYLTLGRGR